MYIQKRVAVAVLLTGCGARRRSPCYRRGFYLDNGVCPRFYWRLSVGLNRGERGGHPFIVGIAPEIPLTAVVVLVDTHECCASRFGTSRATLRYDSSSSTRSIGFRRSPSRRHPSLPVQHGVFSFLNLVRLAALS